MAENLRFAEYATSGAFTLGLTRNQVSALAMLLGGQPLYMGGPHTASLERKGLVEAVPAPSWDKPEAIELRLTAAGLLTARLVAEAGLTNGPPDPLIEELAALRAETARRRAEAADCRRDARSAMARLQIVELELEQEKARNAGQRMPLRFHIRDPQPDLSREALAERVAAGEPL